MSTILNLTLTVAESIVFYNDSKNAGNITANAAIFNDESENLGTINGTATFNNNSTNAESGTIDGDAQFSGCSLNNGNVTGAITLGNRTPARNCPGYIVSDPPLKASWVTSGRNRRLVIIPSRNFEQFQALGLPIAPIYGPWQPCPPGESCFAYPALYRPFMPADFVIDYEDKPNYLDEPGNPEPAE